MVPYDMKFSPGVQLTKVVKWLTPTLDANGNPVRGSDGQIVRVPVVTTAWQGLFVVYGPRSSAAVLQVGAALTPSGQITNDGAGAFGLMLTGEATASIKSSMSYRLLVVDNSLVPVKELLVGSFIDA